MARARSTEVTTVCEGSDESVVSETAVIAVQYRVPIQIEHTLENASTSTSTATVTQGPLIDLRHAGTRA